MLLEGTPPQNLRKGQIPFQLRGVGRQQEGIAPRGNRGRILMAITTSRWCTIPDDIPIAIRIDASCSLDSVTVLRKHFLIWPLRVKKKTMTNSLSHAPLYSYYGYRALGSFEEDPRLRLFKEEWFHNRDVLDVGCNEGLITLAVATRFKCRRVTGVDIDGTLIKRAKR
jgi:hypothetical protein